MKKLATFIVAFLFALALIFTVVDSANRGLDKKSGSTYASIIPIPPPLDKNKTGSTTTK